LAVGLWLDIGVVLWYARLQKLRSWLIRSLDILLKVRCHHITRFANNPIVTVDNDGRHGAFVIVLAMVGHVDVVTLHRAELLLGWVTVPWYTHTNIANIAFYRQRDGKMSGQAVMMLFSWGVKAVMTHPTCVLNVWVAH